jgi:hypothetical protein
MIIGKGDMRMKKECPPASRKNILFRTERTNKKTKSRYGPEYGD